MRKLFYLGFCLVLAMGVGCAITNYGIIVDNDQGNGSSQDVVNTNGKAHILESSQIATIWSDGTDEIFTHIDQASDGTAVLTNYNNFSSGSIIFHDDTYCNPDWNGCSIFTAPDNNDANIFDGSFNTNCSGARSLSVLLSTGRYYGECGRGNTSLADRMAFMNLGQLVNMMGMEGLAYTATAQNTTILASNAGGSQILPFAGAIPVTFFANDRLGVVDFTNPLLRSLTDQISNFINATGSPQVNFTITYNGISFEHNTEIIEDALNRFKTSKF